MFDQVWYGTKDHRRRMLTIHRKMRTRGKEKKKEEKGYQFEFGCKAVSGKMSSLKSVQRS